MKTYDITIDPKDEHQGVNKIKLTSNPIAPWLTFGESENIGINIGSIGDPNETIDL